MDTKVMFVWLIVIVVTSALVFFLRYENKKLAEKKLTPLKDFARENNCEISSYDRWDKTLIGLENSGVNKLFFIRKVFDNELKTMINLSEIKNCQLVKTTRTVHFNNEKVSVIDKLELDFSFLEKNKHDVLLEFYNSDYDHLNLSGELQLAEKWTETVNGLISGAKNLDEKADNVKPFSTLNKLHAKAGVL